MHDGVSPIPKKVFGNLIPCEPHSQKAFPRVGMETEQTTVAVETTGTRTLLSETTGSLRRRTSSFLIPCLLILLTLFAYGQVPHNQFISLDDNLYVTDNVHVQRGLTWENVGWSFTTTHAGNWHPLTWLSHMLDYELCGLNPAGHHMTNLLLHLANVLVLFWALQRMPGSLWKNFFVAALFALHPLHVESVAWIAERKDVLSTFFWMLTILVYTYYAERPGAWRYAGVCICFVSGLLSKPMMVTLPFVLLLVDYWPLGRMEIKRWTFSSSSVSTSPTGATSPYRLILEKMPLFLLTVVSCALTLFAQWRSGAVGSLKGLPISERFANALVSYIQYISKMVWPQDMAVLYPHPLHWPLWEVLGSAFLLGIVTFSILRAGRKYPYLLVGWLWYLGTLVPVIGLVQVGFQGIADRYTYLPLIGLFMIVAYGIPEVLKGGWGRKLALYVVAPLLMIVLLCVTRNQVLRWQSSTTLFEHTLRVTINNSVIHNNLGVVLLAQGKDNEARGHFVEALRIRPGYADAHYNLGALLAREGKDAEAVSHLLQALRYNPGLADAHNYLGAISLKEGNLQEAVFQFSETIRLNPDHAYGHNNLAVVLAREKKFQEAIAHLRRAIQISPAYAEAHLNLGIGYWETGNKDGALRQYEILQRIDPARAALLSQSMK
jgi:Flp pilus assembly protein TadD